MKIVEIGVRCFLPMSNSGTVLDSNFSIEKANGNACAKFIWRSLHLWHVEFLFTETSLSAEDSAQICRAGSLETS